MKIVTAKKTTMTMRKSITSRATTKRTLGWRS
jgi:hypothetical protein